MKYSTNIIEAIQTGLKYHVVKKDTIVSYDNLRSAELECIAANFSLTEDAHGMFTPEFQAKILTIID